VTATLGNPGGVQDGQPLVMIIDFMNTGKSQAVKVRTCQIAKRVDRKRAQDMDINRPSKAISPGFQVVLPNTSTKRMGNAAGGNNEPPVTPDGLLTPALHEDLSKVKRIAITYGFAEYDDIFRIHHWTKFCYQLVVMPPTPGGMPETSNWLVCDIGNDIDPNYD
jgi:hypothetical protein